MELLSHTVKAYREAIAPSLPSMQNVHTLFSNNVPNLQDRIDCFTNDDIEKVAQHNLKKMHDRTLEAKLKQARDKTKRPRKQPSARDTTQPPPQNSIAWSPQQQAIVTAASDFLNKFTDWKNGNAPPPKPLNILIFRGPGALHFLSLYSQYSPYTVI